MLLQGRDRKSGLKFSKPSFQKSDVSIKGNRGDTFPADALFCKHLQISACFALLQNFQLPPVSVHLFIPTKPATVTFSNV